MARAEQSERAGLIAAGARCDDRTVQARDACTAGRSKSTFDARPSEVCFLVRQDRFLEPTRQRYDRTQRRQGCAAPAGRDLDDGAMRGRMMAGRLVVGRNGRSP
jgi:hypothetical protein